MKVKTLVGTAVAVSISLIAILALLLLILPGKMASWTGVGPLDNNRVMICCLSLAAVLILAGWLIEKAFERAGVSGLQLAFRRNTQPMPVEGQGPLFHAGAEQQRLDPLNLTDHCKMRYGRLWAGKIRILLIQGQNELIEKVLPGLNHQRWQEGEGIVFIHGGEPQSPWDDALLSALKSLRRRPLDGVVQIVSAASLPDKAHLDAFKRARRQADSSIGWQIPVWLWLMDEEDWPQVRRDSVATGVLFNSGAGVDDALAALQNLKPRLRQAGMALLLADSRHNWLLRLSYRLQQELKPCLSEILHELMQGPAAYRLRGVMFSPALAGGGAGPHVYVGVPAWRAVVNDSRVANAQKQGIHWQKALPVSLLLASVFWCVGAVLSLMVNRAQIVAVQETARHAANPAQPLAARLCNQLILQQAIARLQHRQAGGAPWYTRFGLNQDRRQLTALWPIYARHYHQLMGDAAAAHLKQQLTHFITLPPGSGARTQGTLQAYKQLKAYLMLARPDKADAAWLAQQLPSLWPKRQSVPENSWRDVAPKLLGFWAHNVQAHPQWKIAPDADVIAAVRQILLKHIGQRNAESALYQDMLKRLASNWPDLTLADMTGDTDASALFSSVETVSGMFTRQAWEEQVQSAIDEAVKTRRDEIDWVLTDKTHPPQSDVSPEALKARLTARYFTDFGNAWLTMVNSIQWRKASSLSDVIAQLNVLADVRHSPLVALMDMLVWQGQTGQKSDALADTLVDSAKKLIGGNKQTQFMQQAIRPKGPLESVFGPLIGLMKGKDGAGNNPLSFQSWLARVMQVRLKLQQVSSASDPQAMAQMLAQTVFQGKSIDLTDTRDYGSLVAASLGQEWCGFGQALFVQPLDLAWRQVLAPAAASLNSRWQSTIATQWNTAFAGRYPFRARGSDASLPLLAQFLRADSGRIAAFLKTHLSGVLYQEGNRWLEDPSASQGMRINPAFLNAINLLAEIGDIAFAQGDAGLRFELMPRPSRPIARMRLDMDGQSLDYFNQMTGWQSFIWPGNTFYPGVQLSWRGVNSGMRLLADHPGHWGLLRLLEKAQATPLDGSRSRLVWTTPEGDPLMVILRGELGDGPLTLLKLRGFVLPETIFIMPSGSGAIKRSR